MPPGYVINRPFYPALYFSLWKFEH
jgi:hypothetical protein